MLIVIADPHALHPYISMELATAYVASRSTSSHPDISYRRTVRLDTVHDHVILNDITNASDVILNFITYEKPYLSSHSPNTLIIGNANFNFENAALMEIESLSITDPRLQTAWNHDLYRIRIKMKSGTFHCTIQ